MNDDLAKVKDATRKLHEAMRDAKIVQRELDETVASVRAVVPAMIENEVKQGLAAYEKSIKDAIDQATAKVFERFDGIAAMLLGEEKHQRRKGTPSIPKLIEMKVELERREGHATD